MTRIINVMQKPAPGMVLKFEPNKGSAKYRNKTANKLSSKFINLLRYRTISKLEKMYINKERKRLSEH